jgi:hypothetical protein
MALACEPPQASGRPLTRWTSRDLADELVQRGIVTAMSRVTVSRLLQESKAISGKEFTSLTRLNQYIPLG